MPTEKKNCMGVPAEAVDPLLTHPLPRVVEELPSRIASQRPRWQTCCKHKKRKDDRRSASRLENRSRGCENKHRRLRRLGESLNMFSRCCVCVSGAGGPKLTRDGKRYCRSHAQIFDAEFGRRGRGLSVPTPTSKRDRRKRREPKIRCAHSSSFAVSTPLGDWRKNPRRKKEWRLPRRPHEAVRFCCLRKYAYSVVRFDSLKGAPAIFWGIILTMVDRHG